MLGKIKEFVDSKSGPGQLLRAANNFRLIPDKYALVLDGLSRAPTPKLISLGSDWFKNLDVIAHSVGCVIAGMFDDLVEGMPLEDVQALTRKDIEGLAPQGLLGDFLLQSFEVCQEIYLTEGRLTDLVESGAVRPEGLVTKIAVDQFVASRKTAGDMDDQPTSKLGRLLGSNRDLPVNDTV